MKKRTWVFGALVVLVAAGVVVAAKRGDLWSGGADSEIVGVHFRDGVMVREGDPLFTLDSRALQAQIRQVQGLLEGAKAQLEQAERDVSRYTELIAKNATTQVTLNNALPSPVASAWRPSRSATLSAKPT